MTAARTALRAITGQRIDWAWPEGAGRVEVAALGDPPLVLCRKPIEAGDERALEPEEAAAFGRAVETVRRQSGAARLAARAGLAALGGPRAPLPRSSSGAPVWPEGFVGSLAHDDAWALAAVALRRRLIGVGVDIEPNAPLPPELRDLVPTTAERGRYAGDVLESRALFVAKEAVFKATHPIDGAFLDFHDIEVDFIRGEAIVSTGRCVRLALIECHHLVALAWLDPS